MSLRFKCPNCGNEIISKFLRIGEPCLCSNCQRISSIPNEAEECGEESSIVKHVNDNIHLQQYKKDDSTPQIDDNLADRTARLAAQIIDGVIGVAFVLLFMMFALSSIKNTSSIGLVFVAYIMALLIVLSVQGYFLTTRGQSLGKMIVKIKIVQFDSGKNGGFLHNVLLRIILNGIISLIPFYGIINILFIFSSDCRCLHDHIAGTKVINVESSIKSS